jgi:hypothetical protein
MKKISLIGSEIRLLESGWPNMSLDSKTQIQTIGLVTNNHLLDFVLGK